MKLNVLIKHSMNLIFSNQNMYRENSNLLYKLVKIKTQNQIRAKLIVAKAGPAPRGAFRGRAPQMTACSPQTKIVPP